MNFREIHNIANLLKYNYLIYNDKIEKSIPKHKKIP